MTSIKMKGSDDQTKLLSDTGGKKPIGLKPSASSGSLDEKISKKGALTLEEHEFELEEDQKREKFSALVKESSILQIQLRFIVPQLLSAFGAQIFRLCSVNIQLKYFGA